MTEPWTAVSKPTRASRSSSSASASGTKVPVHVTPVNDSLFELHKPGGTPQMQVLFFNGLQFENTSNMHLSTWECGDGSLWPQTWLVEEFPRAHVLCVSYYGRIRSDSQGFLDMFLMDENIILELLVSGIGQIVDCPIITVGHSLGGLAIKQPCCHAHRKLHLSEGVEKAKLQAFLGNIRGIFYYPTPHLGSNLVEKMAETESNPLLKYFQTLSANSARLNAEFEQIRRLYGNWRIFGLGEGLPTKLSRFRDDMLVPEASARVENFYTVSGADHYSICKPESKTSAGFYELKTFIDNIAGDAEVEVNHFDNLQYLPEYILGIDDQVQESLAVLVNARTLGLFGMGGVGKTTMAKALFNKLGPSFEYTCFVPNVKQIDGDENALKNEVWKWMHCRGQAVSNEKNWNDLKGRALLLVLDDISSKHSERDVTLISNLVINTSERSRFIVTSREGELRKRFESSLHVSLLNQRAATELFLNLAFPKDRAQKLLQVLEMFFEVPFLEGSDSKERFRSHAFPNSSIIPLNLASVMVDVVKRCAGLPLALKVLARHLRNKEDKDWKRVQRALDRVESPSPQERLWSVLRLSYDGLEETGKKIFLDVTTFFCNGQFSLGEAKAAWRTAYKTNCESRLWQTLVDRSLVKYVEDDERIQVHEQVQSLGRIIAAECNKHRPLRVWEEQMALKVLQTPGHVKDKEFHSLQLESNSRGDKGLIHIASVALHKLKQLLFWKLMAQSSLMDPRKMIHRLMSFLY